jgi:hypothetical protein
MNLGSKPNHKNPDLLYHTVMPSVAPEILMSVWELASHSLLQFTATNEAADHLFMDHRFKGNFVFFQKASYETVK